MFFGNEVQDTRQVFFDSWNNYQAKKPLSPLEQQVVEVIKAHPEYHGIFSDQSMLLNKAYFPEFGETNPFLHMGLHLAVREQIATDRPAGITKVFKKLLKLKRFQNRLDVEHKMMDCLAESLWQAQRQNTAPNPINYLSLLTQLLE